jgi:hypothetical protein
MWLAPARALAPVMQWRPVSSAGRRFGEVNAMSSTRGLAIRLFALTVTCTAIGFVFWLFVRPAYLNWGSTAEERVMRLPGDEIVPDAA